MLIFFEKNTKTYSKIVIEKLGWSIEYNYLLLQLSYHKMIFKDYDKHGIFLRNMKLKYKCRIDINENYVLQTINFDE